ncbi:MAG: alpha/beta hydrolase [Bryobacterales bacterium]|nr:alpha/beta hydrolase [Bryobacterales bacterium]
MARRIESLFVDGPAGKLEALLEEPEDREPEQAALVCHPHPLHGGTMHNKVVYRIARGFRRSAHVVLRFNFRGVNLSEGAHGHGIGEVEDAKAALAVLRQRYPALPYSIAGFSFGSRVVLKMAQDCADARRAVAVGFPPQYAHAEDLLPSPIPRVFVHSRVDAICSPEGAHHFYETLPGTKQFHWVDAQDHFFAGGLPALEQLIADLG